MACPQQIKAKIGDWDLSKTQTLVLSVIIQFLNALSMKHTSRKIKNLKTEQLFFILSVCAFIYWFLPQVFNVYHFALVGAVFEILWLPMLAILFILPILIFIFWIKKIFIIKSFFLYSMLLCITTILLILFKK